MKLLLAREDIGVNSEDYHGQTPLSEAACGGHEDVMKSLLAHGAS